ncbi:MAG TPA: hypothetical protein VFD58_29705 [Blastocatellia bacterium]|nr:hypothetical protein [Blastocatellia bacterium]
MKIRQVVLVEPEPESLKGHSNSISPAVSSTAERWRTLSRDPLFMALLVWVFLFLLAAAVNVLP